MSGIVVSPQGITDPPIDDLLAKTGSKYALVIVAAKRARQINAYYSDLEAGLLQNVGPLVDAQNQEKPLSIALREIVGDIIEFGEPSGEPEVPGAADFGGDFGDDHSFDGA
ncbi:MAG: hypothetical protein RLZ55_1057 [Actinomycetota bacterium]